jgi:hypothetical protein
MGVIMILNKLELKKFSIKHLHYLGIITTVKVKYSLATNVSMSLFSQII